MPSNIFVMHVVECAAGGVRRHVLDLAAGLARLGFRQAVVFPPTAADFGFREGVTRLTRQGITFLECEMAHSVGLTDVGAVLRLRRLMRRTCPHLIHLHSSKAGALGRLAALLGIRQPVVYTPHATGAHLGWLYHVAEWLLGRLRTSACIAVSPSEVADLVRFRLVRPGRIRQITNGIDATEVTQAAARAKGQMRTVDVTVCGRITRQKDPVTAAHASALVLRQRPSTAFRWVGDGDMRAVFEGELQKLGIRQHWEITGWVDSAYGHMAASRLMWLPSAYESFGYVTLEAMALGIPTIGTKVAGTSDLIADGRNGYLIDVGDAEALASKTLRCLTDDRLWEALSIGARAKAGELSLAAMARETAALYRSLLTTAGRHQQGEAGASVHGARLASPPQL